MQFYNTSSVYHIVCSPPQVKSSSITIYPLLPSSISPPFPSGNHHTVVCGQPKNLNSHNRCRDILFLIEKTISKVRVIEMFLGKLPIMPLPEYSILYFSKPCIHIHICNLV